jgi:adhesin transport system membrane fusion protein
MNANHFPEESHATPSGPVAATNPAASTCSCTSLQSGREIKSPGQKPQDRARAFAVELDEITSRSRISASLLLIVVTLLFIAAVVWAANAPLDEVVRGAGKIIPSTEIKRIQNFEGGIVKEIRVREGEQVAKGQLLILLDQTQMTSRFREQHSTFLDQILAIARLEAELAGKDTIDFPAEVKDQKPHLLESQQELLRSRTANRQSALIVLETAREQRAQELKELRNRLDFQQRNHLLLKKEVDMTRTMVSKGAASDMELLRAQRQLTELAGQIAETRIAIPKVAAALDGATHRIEEEKSKQRTEILNELNTIRTEMEGRKEKLPALEDQMDRTSVRSPVDGTVKRVFVTTIGEAVGPGKEMLEIVPREDTLLVEAKIPPRDIAFLHPGQAADVKITAYDFSIYGSMAGIVEHISADAITDEQQKQSYYLIKVRTKTGSLTSRNGEELPIIPGMVAEVDVLTGKKTVLEYILKPIIKTTRGALRER